MFNDNFKIYALVKHVALKSNETSLFGTFYRETSKRLLFWQITKIHYNIKVHHKVIIFYDIKHHRSITTGKIHIMYLGIYMRHYARQTGSAKAIDMTKNKV